MTLERIAIVGRGAVLPGERGAAGLWDLVREGRSAAREPPPGRWLRTPDEVHVRGAVTPDRVSSRRACFVESFALDLAFLELTREEAALLDELDESVHWALQAGVAAFRQADLERCDRARMGVILGNIALPTEAASRFSRELMDALLEARLAGLGPALAGLGPALAGDRRRRRAHPLNTLVTTLPASTLARALRLRGPAFTLDAACASSLYAIKLAMDELVEGRADAMLAGGVARPDPLYTQTGFSQLLAVSPDGVCAPLSGSANGLVVGEGAAVFLLKRLDDALRDGDRIQAVLCGVGLSNDLGGSLLAPDSEGQGRALEEAYRSAGWSPRDVDLIECHATGTPTGDRVELESLRALWSRSGQGAAANRPGARAVLGAVKSNIGHLLTAAGAAGLYKTLLAIENEALPPTAGFTGPAPGAGLEESPFEVLSSARPWALRSPGTPRRAAVSAFGFGGINAHILLEERREEASAGAVSGWRPGRPGPSEREGAQRGGRDEEGAVAIVGLAARIGPWSEAESFRARVLGAREAREAVAPEGAAALDAASADPLALGAGRLAHPVRELAWRPGEARIPPRELGAMLLQQSLLLKAALEAARDARAELPGGSRTGVYVGLSLDLETTAYTTRWGMGEAARRWNERLELGLDEEALAAWTRALEDAASAPLDASRTLGGLGGLVPSRIARELRVGGPCFTLSGEEGSGLRALEAARRALLRKEVDAAVVGAVDSGTDPRAMASGALLARALDAPPAGAAVAVVLKRLEDARASGDRILAIVRGLGSASDGAMSRSSPSAQALLAARARSLHEAGGRAEDFVETQALGGDDDTGASAEQAVLEAMASEPVVEEGEASPPATVVGSVRRLVGDAGAAAGLLAVARAALALFHEILPPFGAGELPVDLPAGVQARERATPWVRDRARGPRRAGVLSLARDGSAFHVLLEGEEASSPAPRPRVELERRRPLGPWSEGIFLLSATSPSALESELERLGRLARSPGATPVDALAEAWLGSETSALSPPLPGEARGAVVASSVEELLEGLERLRSAVRAGEEIGASRKGAAVFYQPVPWARGTKVAFLFPGSGCHFHGMGRDLGLLVPEALRRQDRENLHLRSQLAADVFWGPDAEAAIEHQPHDLLFGQVACGALVSDVLQLFGLRPSAAIGYSLGESASLFALRAWRARDVMFERMLRSPLFQSELAGSCEAARRAWGLEEDASIRWRVALLPRPPAEVRAALDRLRRRDVYLLIINTDSECVVGGREESLRELGAALRAPLLPLEGVTIAHCEVVREVAEAYRDLHLLPVTPPEGVAYYSGAWARAYDVSPERAADSILAHALGGLDLRALLSAAHGDGVRVFVETGPGNSLTRRVSQVLAGQPHVAVAASHPGQDGPPALLRALARLHAEGLDLDLSPLYGLSREARATLSRTASPATATGSTLEPAALATSASERSVRIQRSFALPRLPLPPTRPVLPPRVPEGAGEERIEDDSTPAPSGPLQRDARSSLESPAEEPDPSPRPPAPVERAGPQRRAHGATREPSRVHAPMRGDAPVYEAGALPTPAPSAPERTAPRDRAVAAVLEHAEAVLGAHAAYLRATATLEAALAAATRERSGHRPPGPRGPFEAAPGRSWRDPGDSSGPAGLQPPAAVQSPREVPRSIGREGCLELATGSLAAVLGPRFAEVDSFPTRVRLPDEPLMLVDRILAIEGEPRSLGRGRVITEHDVLRDDWYLDAGRIPTAIAVEAGQADLFLSGFLGIDFATRGLAVYRLLDAVVTFQDALPRAGAVIRYDIRIREFFRQGETHLFRFEFDATVDGRPFLTMRDGCAGFFTATELAAGQGIVESQLALAARAATPLSTLAPLAPHEPGAVETLAPAHLRALRQGDLAGAFGPAFEGLAVERPLTIPGAREPRLELVDRITSLQLDGGSRGLGLVRGTMDIRPEDWFLTCHFVDDPVMPGTLMYECCLHTLRTLLLRRGWIVEDDGVAAFEPVPGVASRLRCRGQVLASTRVVTYEVEVLDLSFAPEPRALARALMYADGKPIVEIQDMSVRLSGATREGLEALWASHGRAPHPARSPAPSPSSSATPSDSAAAPGTTPATLPRGRAPKAALVPDEKILAFAVGAPSQAFGEPYRIFDTGRVIARLPGPPYKFLDRITEIAARPWQLDEGAAAEAQYDVPPDAWYFRESGAADPATARMPFCILLEAALQPCGWLAAYLGSALTSDADLSFRNLGGEAVLHRHVSPRAGTLTTRVVMTRCSRSGGMLIQHFDLDVRDALGPIYSGTTYFGFFSKAALADQVGLRDVKAYTPSREELEEAVAFHLPRGPGYPGERLRMVDRIEALSRGGGPAGLGFARGSIEVDPEAWFFRAHFHQDPVWPGSLGLESFLQALACLSETRWGPPGAGRQLLLAEGSRHRWTYRGQVLPTDRKVTVEAVVDRVDPARRGLVASGHLGVDGRRIYAMEGFHVEAGPGR